MTSCACWDFLNKGRTFDSFQFIAKLPSLNDLLKGIERGIETSLATSFSILLLVSSGPVALFGFNSLINVSTSVAVQEMSESLLFVLASNGVLDVTVLDTGYRCEVVI